MISLCEFGLEDKYTVIKKDDIAKLMQVDYVKAVNFLEAIEQIKRIRMHYGKCNSNEYIVVNIDEPYATEVAELVMSGK